MRRAGSMRPKQKQRVTVLEEDAAFRETIRAGVAQLERGELVAHEHVMASGDPAATHAARAMKLV